MLCFRLFNETSPATPLADAVARLREGQSHSSLYEVDPGVFQNLPNASIAYWAPEVLLRLKVNRYSFSPKYGLSVVGLQTSDNHRFTRLTWEIESVNTSNRFYAPFIIACATTKYYSDLPVSINWNNNGEEIKSFNGSVVRNEEHYFFPGISWGRRTYSFRPAIIGKGAIPSVSRYLARSGSHASTLQLVSLWSSLVIDLWLKQSMEHTERPNYISGIIEQIPMPSRSLAEVDGLSEMCTSAWSTKRRTDTATLTSHAFHAPALAPGRKPHTR